MSDELNIVVFELDEAWTLAVENAVRGLKPSAVKTPAGGILYKVEREEGLATSILAAPGFLKKAEGWVGTSRFDLGVPDLDHLLIWDPASPGAASFEREVLSQRRPDAVNFDPVILRVDGGALTVKRS